MNAAQIDFQQLRIKHILFKSKVRSVLYGGIYDEAFFSRTGPVNIWFTSIGKVKYGHVTELNELLKVQQDLNTAAQEIISLYRSGKIDAAHDGLKIVDMKSEQFIRLLEQLEKRFQV